MDATTITVSRLTDGGVGVVPDEGSRRLDPPVMYLGMIGKSPRDPLNGFVDMWYHVFLWSLFSSILVHIVAALITFLRLRKHPIGRFIPIPICVVGFLSPITVGAITSAAICGVYRASGFEMAPLYALVWGVGQTIVIIFISFTRILATL